MTATSRRLAVMKLALRGIEADLVDCMVALPGQLFFSTQIPVCLWFLAKNKNGEAKRGFRDCRQQILFIDARKLGSPDCFQNIRIVSFRKDSADQSNFSEIMCPVCPPAGNSFVGTL